MSSFDSAVKLKGPRLNFIARKIILLLLQLYDRYFYYSITCSHSPAIFITILSIVFPLNLLLPSYGLYRALNVIIGLSFPYHCVIVPEYHP